METEEPITHVKVERTCFHCKGDGRVPGGQRQYGEVIRCPVCEGKGRTGLSITLAELKRLLRLASDGCGICGPLAEQPCHHVSKSQVK